MWQPSCSLELLKARAELYAQVRAFFMARGVLEVETPILGSSTATDPHLESVPVLLKEWASALPTKYYLHTSPEFPMKRLLASGSGAIYQICKTFRNGETGVRHNPEFSMLEWYRPGFCLSDLQREVFELVSESCGFTQFNELSYRQAFIEHLSVDPFVLSDHELSELAAKSTGYQGETLDRDDSLNLLLSHHIEPKLGQDYPCFLREYPASQASLAQTRLDEYGHLVADRFELYINGLEIANAYFELTDAKEQKKRFEEDNESRKTMALPEIPVDHNLLDALSAGMPSCSGVALGLDRLLMIQQGIDNIEQVLSFPVSRA